ncbi:hypothetical protein KR222_008586 [Zaprionus bogoriensis]|nr:hypothetical protein KR222_008586 [Zaprionus bogoriensis]
MGSANKVVVELEEPPSSESSFDSALAAQCCKEERERYRQVEELESDQQHKQLEKSPSVLSGGRNYAASKNVAEGLMDIALLSANANQLRFLITYNHEASTFYYSLVLVILSLVLQLFVGLMLIFKRRLKNSHSSRYMRTNEVLVMGVFLITVINVLLAAFTTTDGKAN